MGKVSGKDLVKFNQWTDARRRCYYAIEDAQEAKAPSLFEYRGVALRKSPVMRYLQGLFGLLFCIVSALPEDMFGSFIVYSYLKEMSVSMLVLLFGYRLAQMARDNEIQGFDRTYRRKIFYPLLVSRGIPLFFAYFVYAAVATWQGMLSVSLERICYAFFESPFADISYIGIIFLQFLLVFPLLWNILYSRDKRKVNKRMWMTAIFYVGYEILRGTFFIPASVYHLFFMRYLLSFSLGMLLFIRRRKGLTLWEIIASGVVGILCPVGGYFLTTMKGSYRAFLSGFQDMPFASGVGTLTVFAVLVPLLTRWRYFRMSEPSHTVVALPGKSYYNIIMTAAVLFGLDITFSIGGKVVEPQELLQILACIIIGILWQLTTKSRWWRYFLERIFAAEKGIINKAFCLKRNILIGWKKLCIRYYDQRLKVERE